MAHHANTGDPPDAPPGAPDETAPPFHAVTAEQALERLGVTDAGLTGPQADARLAEAGPNVIPSRPPPPWWMVLLRQLRSPLVYILVAAAGVSLAIGHATDAGFIGAVVLINTLVGAFQEHRAERSARALQQLLRASASVVRDGEIVDIDAERVVPGDVVHVESGNRVPADLRLLSAHALEIDESLLTGESAPVHKDPDWIGQENTTLADRLNMAHAGSIVAHGRARGVAVATGGHTHVGRLAMDVIGSPRGEPPLLVRLHRFTRVVGIVVVAGALVVGVAGVLLQGAAPSEMFLFGVALAVSAIPEGLPIAITIALAVAATRMARRGVIVRRLAAVEGLGSCTLIASDKTGTLTCNELTVRRIATAGGREMEVTGEGFTPHGAILRDGTPVRHGDDPRLDDLALAAVLCNEADLHERDGGWAWHGDATDIALLGMGHKLGLVRELALDRSPEVTRIPFEPERRFAASFHRRDGRTIALVKGAPERILEMAEAGHDPAPAALHRLADSLAERGYRVLALADGQGPPDLEPDDVPPEPASLRVLGFVGMIDPLRPGVADAVRACADAGITVCMVTGDHPSTALVIARDLGMAASPDQVVTGARLADLDEHRLAEVVAATRVFARVAPRQKLDIVNAARAAGHFVAVTGDGVNDAPALRAANIGVAMGRSGTDVAREAAELVISDDNFATIVAGIEEGRIAYDNVRKVVFLLASTGAAEVVLVGLAVATDLPLPLLPAQLLWLNLVTNGIQDVALAFEPGERDVLTRRPRPPSERIFDRVMIENTIVSAGVMGGAGFAAFSWMIDAGWDPPAARNTLLLLMVLFENVHIGVCRFETRSAFSRSPLASPLLFFGAIGAFGLHVLAMHVPIVSGILSTEPVSLRTWITLAAIALGVFALLELHKLRWRWRPPTRRQPASGSS